MEQDICVFNKTPSILERETHYCPGCHHGIAHRLVCEVIDEEHNPEETILVASIGCSAFIYDYMNFDCIESPHGRASAVLTGVKRARPDRLAFAYQGDGDLAAIGIGEALHCANRGEKVTVIFINNAVYGMTGGQMAPTTLIGQKTSTSQQGRAQSSDGSPLHMAEMMSNLGGVAYSARVALDTVGHIKEAKKAIKNAFAVQAQNVGYGFVEILANCNTNWYMTPVQANQHITNSMIPNFPLGEYKNILKEAQG